MREVQLLPFCRELAQHVDGCVTLFVQVAGHPVLSCEGFLSFVLLSARRVTLMDLEYR